MVEKSKRVGKFTIDFATIDNDPLIVYQMLAGKVIVRAEARHELQAIEYHAYCDDFDEVEQGHQIPEYVAEFIEQIISEDNSDRSSRGVVNVFERWVKV